jgi:hypothetical protein
MKKLWLMLPVLAVLSSCNSKPAADTSAADTVLTVEEILATPEQYLEKEVVISGLVTHVCKHGGQKLFIAGAETETLLRINTSESIPEFGLDMEGSKVEFKGTLKLMDEALAAASEAEEKEHHPEENDSTVAEDKSNRNTEYYLVAGSFRTL